MYRLRRVQGEVNNKQQVQNQVGLICRSARNGLVLVEFHGNFRATGIKVPSFTGMLHRDLKPRYILIDENCDLKICDIGLGVQEVLKRKIYTHGLFYSTLFCHRAILFVICTLSRLRIS